MASLRRSMYLAFIGGIGIPILETIRRWHQLTDLHHFINWFDDYAMGGFLVFAAWKTYRSAEIGRQYLCAAWGAATGMMFMSFFGQLQHLDQPDPAPVSAMMVVVIKGLLFCGSLSGLLLALKKYDERSR